MPNTITPDDDAAVTSAVASMRRHIAQKLATVTTDLPEPPEALLQRSLPEPIRQRMLEDAERMRECEAYGHRLIPDTDDLFMCSICTKRFRLVA